MKRPDAQTLFLAGVVISSSLLIGYVVFGRGDDVDGAPPPVSKLKLEDIPFNGARAYEYLQELCQIGPRQSGSPGMTQQQKLITDHFQKLGGQVERQEFTIRHPLTGAPVPMTNLIIHWHPDRKQRVLLATHYDTRPYPDQDPVNPRGNFIGANDGGSGTALLMELGHEMPDLKGAIGVDFVLLDGEEFVFNNQNEYFLGSEYFARAYATQPPPYHYRWGVLLDMIGDADLQIYQERNSLTHETRPLVEMIWRTAGKLGVKEFIARPKYEIRDDHLALNNVGKIPTCDLIDFDYPNEQSRISFWHTEADTADKCSALSLAKVGWVMSEWLKSLK